MHCSSSGSRLALVKPLETSGKNGERALSLMEKINTKARDFQAAEYHKLPHLENPAIVNKQPQLSWPAKSFDKILMNLLGPLKRSFFLSGLHVCGQKWGVLQCGLVDRRAHADSNEVICKGRPVNIKARVLKKGRSGVCALCQSPNRAEGGEK